MGWYVDLLLHFLEFGWGFIWTIKNDSNDIQYFNSQIPSYYSIQFVILVETTLDCWSQIWRLVTKSASPQANITISKYLYNIMSLRFVNWGVRKSGISRVLIDCRCAGCVRSVGGGGDCQASYAAVKCRQADRQYPLQSSVKTRIVSWKYPTNDT